MEPLLDRATDTFGHVDILACNHARSGSDGTPLELDATTLDTRWQVDADDPARLVAWLVSDEGRWVVGQLIDSEGSFRRSRW